jgi:hypothetical protein
MTDPAGGPKTQAGKEVARWNATRHGIRSPAPVVLGLEKAEDWESHRDGMLESLSPEGHLEFVLAEQVALLSWRLHRVIRYETESIALYQEKMEDDLSEQRQFDSRVRGPKHPEDVRRDLESARAKQRLLKRLPKLKADKRLSGFEADTILWEVMKNADPVVEGEVVPEDFVEEISIPGVPEGTDWEDYGGWTVEAVRAGIEAIASATDEDPEELIEVATAGASRNLIDAKKAGDRVEKDLEKMSRERLLPDEKTLGKVARYEAHLSRGLYKALHELEALQTRRLGGSAPLARLDVDGLAER